MTDHELEQRLRTWYRAEIPAAEVAPGALRASVVAIPGAIPAPPRLLGPRRNIRLLAIAAVLAAALVGVALLAGSRPFRLPTVVAPSDGPSAPTTAVQSPDVGVPDRIVYTQWRRVVKGEDGCASAVCNRASIFIADADGSGEQELIPGPMSHLLAASSDGSKLIVSIRVGAVDALFLTDGSGSTPRPFATLCETPCSGDSSFAFSPDATRVAWVRGLTGGTSVIAVMDLSTGAVRELASTIGVATSPSWSPDSSRLVFANHVVDANGRNLREIAPAALFTGMDGEFSPALATSQWSPDADLIVLTSYKDTLVSNPPTQSSQRLMDLYVVRPDGTGLKRLTNDTAEPPSTNEAGDFGAAFPAWTRDGRITFTRFPVPPEVEFELWVMDADGSNATRLDPSDAAALTALGCAMCTYPALEEIQVPPFAYWIPAR